jgi:hypothetical protein
LATWTELKILYKQQISHTQGNTQTIWTYGIQLWGTAFASNIEIRERFQSEVLRMIVDAPFYMLKGSPNTNS